MNIMNIEVTSVGRIALYLTFINSTLLQAHDLHIAANKNLHCSHVIQVT